MYFQLSVEPHYDKVMPRVKNAILYPMLIKDVTTQKQAGKSGPHKYGTRMWAGFNFKRCAVLAPEEHY